MKLSELALKKVRDSRTMPKRIREAINVSRSTMWAYLNENSDNLTKAAALKIIREETGLTDDEILEVEQQAAA